MDRLSLLNIWGDASSSFDLETLQLPRQSWATQVQSNSASTAEGIRFTYKLNSTPGLQEGTSKWQYKLIWKNWSSLWLKGLIYIVINESVDRRCWPVSSLLPVWVKYELSCAKIDGRTLHATQRRRSSLCCQQSGLRSRFLGNPNAELLFLLVFFWISQLIWEMSFLRNSTQTSAWKGRLISSYHTIRLRVGRLDCSRINA